MKRWVASIIAVFLTSGCIQSDLSHCPSEVVIDFEYTYNMQETDLIDQEVNTVSLFVFDHNDKFVVRQDKAIDKSDRSITFDLEQGIYRFVAWGNLSEHYEAIQLEPQISELKDLHVILKENSGATTHHLSLFHAQLAAEKVERLGLKKKMSFIKNSNSITVTLNYPKTESTPSLRHNNTTGVFTLCSSNGAMDADNNLLTESGVHTYGSLSVTDSEFVDNMQTSAVFSTLQLSNDQPLLFNASSITKDTVSKSFEYDLMQVIQKAPTDLVKQDTFYVEFNFNSSNITSILVNGWKVYTNNGDVGIE